MGTTEMIDARRGEPEAGDDASKPGTGTSQAAEARRAEAPEAVELGGDYALVVDRSAEDDVLTLRGPSGHTELSLHLTEEGPVLRFGGQGLRIVADANLSLSAEELRLEGRSGLTLESGGDLDLKAARDLRSEARIQSIIGRLGNVNVEANDDVRIDGERVLVNCPEL